MHNASFGQFSRGIVEVHVSGNEFDAFPVNDFNRDIKLGVHLSVYVRRISLYRSI